MSIYGQPRKKLKLRLRSWYRIEVHQGSSEEGKVVRIKKHRMSSNFTFKRLITVDVNGKPMMSKEINEVTGILRLFTSPYRGMKPAKGIIRAVKIIVSDEYGNLCKNKKNKNEKPIGTLKGRLTPTQAPTTTTTTTLLTTTDTLSHCYLPGRAAATSDCGKARAKQLGCSHLGLPILCLRLTINTSTLTHVIEYTAYGLRCKCFNKSLKDRKYINGRPNYCWKMQVGYEDCPYNPCFDINCPNQRCYDHPGYKHFPYQDCPTPNCGGQNCKRWPCRGDGSDLGLG